MDLDVVAGRYAQLRAALPDVGIYYAVKANPEPEVVEILARLGAGFDVASPAEVDVCLTRGVPVGRLSYGNTVKKQADITYAYAQGVRLFAFDSAPELRKLAAAAPGAAVFCRLLTTGTGADWPLSRKFGCDPGMAVDLLLEADGLGLDACGVSFHVGSQQRDPGQWEPAVVSAAAVVAEVCRRSGGRVRPRMVNLGGGLPARYLEEVPGIPAYAAAIRASLDRHFPADGPAGRPRVLVEPGRYLVGDAGVLHTEVVLVSRKSYDGERWVYLDTGVFGGLAETLGEAIKYRMVTTRDGGPSAPVVLAGPTCDSLDVLYERYRYSLPLDLTAGDRLTILSAGAYTSAYCTDGFNGFRPMPVHCLPLSAPLRPLPAPSIPLASIPLASAAVPHQEAAELPHVRG
ncbi:MAG: type III PLP-dependent enzyme [Actinomycetota bacterium]|nr:type III PLP-dependent enzyme [Actinomycetota bacterium]MDP9460752.1 type III PLP-dependent enzyme [Actinomycetota bacterium]